MEEKCRQCPNPRGYEVFNYMFGAITFDVALAKKIIAQRIKEGKVPRRATAEKINRLFVQWAPPVTENGVTTYVTGKHYVNEKHLDHIRTDEPIIFATFPDVFKIEGIAGTSLLIDGGHRVARAVRDKKRYIQYVTLTAEETKQVMTVNIPSLLKPKSRKRKAVKSS